MAFIHGKNTFVSVGGTDLSAYTSSSEITRAKDTHDVTGYGNDSKAYIGGLRDHTFSMEGHYDSTASTGPRPVLIAAHESDALVEVIRRPEGTGSALPEDTFDAICTSYVETSPVADKVSWSAEFQISGDIDDTAQSA